MKQICRNSIFDGDKASPKKAPTTPREAKLIEELNELKKKHESYVKDRELAIKRKNEEIATLTDRMVRADRLFRRHKMITMALRTVVVRLSTQALMYFSSDNLLSNHGVANASPYFSSRKTAKEMQYIHSKLDKDFSKIIGEVYDKHEGYVEDVDKNFAIVEMVNSYLEAVEYENVGSNMRKHFQDYYKEIEQIDDFYHDYVSSMERVYKIFRDLRDFDVVNVQLLSNLIGRVESEVRKLNSDASEASGGAMSSDRVLKHTNDILTTALKMESTMAYRRTEDQMFKMHHLKRDMEHLIKTMKLKVRTYDADILDADQFEQVYGEPHPYKKKETDDETKTEKNFLPPTD